MHECDREGFKSRSPRPKPVKPSVVPVHTSHWPRPSDDGGSAVGQGVVFQLEADLPWSSGHHGETYFSLLPGGVRLASKCRLLEVVSSVNNVDDAGHLQRGLLCAAVYLRVELVGPEHAWTVLDLEIVFWSIEGNSFNVYGKVAEFTRTTVFNKGRKGWM